MKILLSAYRFRRKPLIKRHYHRTLLEIQSISSFKDDTPRIRRSLRVHSGNTSKASGDEILFLTNPLMVITVNSKLQTSLISTAEADAHPGLLGLDLRPSLKLDKKVKKNEKDDDKESERAGVKAKVKKKIRSKLNLEDDYESVSYQLETEEVQEDLSLLPLARPPKPVVPSTSGLAFTVKQKSVSSELNKKKRVSTSTTKKETDNITVEKPSEVVLVKPVTVAELSDLFLVSKTDIIKFLFLKGIPVTMNQMIDLNIAQIVGQEFGIKVITETTDLLSETKKADVRLDNLGNLQRRPPIVTIMGHVDHGKTTLLDRIRKTQVAKKEAGGITQKIGAYEVEIDYKDEKRMVVFLDTPGHEAFSGMRSRGVSITDIVILVVAADDGVKKQTLEAIQYIQSANVPLIVAINKIDKEDANLNSIQEELTKYNIVSEDWGGDTLMVPISAIQGTNIDTLLEMIILLSDVMNLQSNPEDLAEGVVIESYLDRTKGAVATVIVQNGTLKVGDIITVGNVMCKVRGMVSSTGLNIKEAEPSCPAVIWGLPKIPSIGDRFYCFKDEKQAKVSLSSEEGSQRSSFGLFQQLKDSYSGSEIDTKEKINLIIKTDTQGSAEAINAVISKISDPKVHVRILYACAGEITETDIEFATTSSATLLAFNTTLASGAKKAAKNLALVIKEFDVIYDLFDYVQSMIDALVGPQYEEKYIGSAIVKAVFPLAKSFVAGSSVTEGKIIKSSVIEVTRGNEVVYKGSISSLKKVKEDVLEVLQDSECGIFVSEFDSWKQGDIIKSFELLPKRKVTL